MTDTNKRAKSLNPIQELNDKNNYQEFILVEKDGSVKKRIILFITNIEIREQVICNHFLSRYVQLFVEEPTGIRFVSRDSPWDFEMELSNSEKIILEITSIADEVDLFKTFKYQERISETSNHEYIEFHELIKLNSLFPNSKNQMIIDSLKEQGIGKDESVLNPHYGKKFIFESSINEDLNSFDNIIREAIDKKVNKNHPNKENVTLIIDNRTVTYELEDIINYLDKLDDYFKTLPFKEVWLYTGYYSNLDGNNAEYSFAPLKIDEIKFEKLKSKLKE
ncbi:MULTISPECIES: hypothetical protein [unclassified Sphingobacterium]|uniref:hypothetical protein n=1 Tax=unclassified Sphingobacterium TaxID=2609468 RepID=UPI0025F06C74|nr:MULTISPECIES: hypothetical protein [unclassified Sphingobacterium]